MSTESILLVILIVVVWIGVGTLLVALFSIEENLENVITGKEAIFNKYDYITRLLGLFTWPLFVPFELLDIRKKIKGYGKEKKNRSGSES